jgi:glycosyltransferase involved in cell wall biosynthesis
MLFLSRIHPKRAFRLLRAWRSVERQFLTGIVVAGPDERGHLAECKAARESSASSACPFQPGLCDGQRDALPSRRRFVLPTQSNFGMVVAEALAAGAVITTTGRPGRAGAAGLRLVDQLSGGISPQPWKRR